MIAERRIVYMVFNFLKWLESQFTKEEFKTILYTEEKDIKFNRVGFNKLTPPFEFIEICLRCASVVKRRL